MSGAGGLPAPLAERLRLRPGSNRGGRPSRRGALLAVLLALAALGAFGAKGAVRRSGDGAAVAAAERQAPPRGAATEAVAARSQPRVKPQPASERVIAPRHAASLFAHHSWYVPPPPPPPARPAPAPPSVPTAPPFPYTFVGSYAPEGDAPVFFLAHGDRVIDARVGDQLEGVYQFESAVGGQLVFLYLPLNLRQNLAARASP